MKIQPKDIFALIIILVFAFLKIRGLNGTLDGVIGLILGYYFVKRTENKDSGQ